MRIYNSETSPTLSNENNDIVDQLALFDTLQIFKQVKVSTQAIRTSVSSVFDQFAADQVQSETDSFPQLEFVDDEEEWEEAEAEARADRTWCSLFLDGSLGEHKTTAPESAIVTVWDSLQEITMYDECDAARELLLYDKWMQSEEQMKKFNLSHLLRGKNLAEMFRRIPDAQKHLQRIPLVVSQSSKRSAQQKRKLLLDAVQADSRSKTARYSHEILSEAVKEHFSTQTTSTRTADRRTSTSNRTRNYDGIECDANTGGDPTAARGVGLCVSLQDLVAGLQALMRWKENDLRGQDIPWEVDSPHSASLLLCDEASAAVETTQVGPLFLEVPELDPVEIALTPQSPNRDAVLETFSQTTGTAIAEPRDMTVRSVASDLEQTKAVKHSISERTANRVHPQSQEAHKKARRETAPSCSSLSDKSRSSFASVLHDSSICTDMVLYKPSPTQTAPVIITDDMSQRLVSRAGGVVLCLNRLVREFACMQSAMGRDVALDHLSIMFSSQWKLQPPFVVAAIQWLRGVTGGRNARKRSSRALLLTNCENIRPEFETVETLGVDSFPLLTATSHEVHVVEELDANRPLSAHSQSSIECGLEMGVDSGPTGHRETDLDSETFFRSNTDALPPHTSESDPFSTEDLGPPTEWCEFRPIQPHALTARRGTFLSVPSWMPPSRVAVIPSAVEESTEAVLSQPPKAVSAVASITEGDKHPLSAMESDLLFFDELFAASSSSHSDEEAPLSGDLHCVSHETESTIDSLSPGEDEALSGDSAETADVSERAVDAAETMTVVRSILKKRPLSVSCITVHLSPSAHHNIADAKKRVRFVSCSQSQGQEGVRRDSSQAVEKVVSDDEEQEDEDVLSSTLLRSKRSRVDLAPSSSESQKLLGEELAYDFFASKQDGCSASSSRHTSSLTSFTTPLFGSPVSPASTSSSESSSGGSGDTLKSTPPEGDWMFGNWVSFDEEEERTTADRFITANTQQYGKQGKKRKMG
eukprot:gene21835-27906_t